MSVNVSGAQHGPQSRTISVLGAASGLLFAILFLGGPDQLVSGTLTPAGNPKDQDALFAYLGAHQTQARLLLILASLAALLFLCFVVYVSRLVRHAEGTPGIYSTLAVFAGNTFVAFLWLSIAINAAVWLAAAENQQAGGYRWSEALIDGIGILTVFPLSMFLAALATVAIARRWLPLWLGLLTAVTAGVQLLEGILTIVIGPDPNSPLGVGSRSAPPAGLLLLLWLVLISILLIRRAWTRRVG